MRIRVNRRRRDGAGHGRADERARPPQHSRSLRVKEQVTRLVIEVGDRASAWRDAALDAELAFRSWASAPPVERAGAAAAYLAAIEREEKAADEYRSAVEACASTRP
jgi:acyl-CoA reductase-like NAD-dependent aldehyde dehydrogenase